MPVREFSDADYSEIADNSFIVCCAPRKAGKTHLISHMVKQLGKRFAAAIVISKTSKLQNSFAFIPEKWHVNPETDGSFEETINKIIAFQVERKEENKKTGQILIICDDLFVSSTKGVGRFSYALARLAATGRHVQVFCILLVQNYSSISPSIRSQANWYITFRPRSLGNREMLMEKFLSRENSGTRSETRERANQILSEVFDGSDSEFRALMIHADNRSSSLDDVVYWIKAPPTLRKWTIKLKKVFDDGGKDGGDGLDENNVDFY